ncbi:MAG: alpha-galactosidase, partial [Alphaproteobacteria bacterium]|nr:alpha-galactosidase [Alphaproteobacteria bacterium]
LVRRLISDEYTPEKRKNDSHGLFAFGLWGGLKSEEMVRRVDLLTNNGINYEQLWIDAGWYGNCTNCEDCFVGDWNNYTGDYSVNLNVHPDRFASVIAAGEKNGMDFMLWFDSEHATNVVPVSIEHPEWMLGYKNDVYKPYNIINFGNEDAWDYVFDMLCSYINEMNIKVYRQDCNADMDVFFAWNDEPDRDGVSEIKHITGMYRLWDSLLEKYPDLIIDNCASGGRRVDMEAIKRSTILCRSDYCCLYNQNPEVLQACTSNSATYFPHIGSFFSFVDRSPSRYAVRSSYNETWASSALQVSSQSSLTTEELRIMKETNDEYCSIREYFDKDFYNHGSKEYDSSSWAIWQYHDPNKNSGIIMAFRRKESPSPYAVIDLKGINDNVVISYRSLDNGTTLEGNRTITLELPEKESALIYEYIVK